MAPRVVADLVPRGHHGLHQMRMLVHEPPDHEERRLHAVIGEQRQEALGVERVGTVVERQRDNRRARGNRPHDALPTTPDTAEGPVLAAVLIVDVFERPDRRTAGGGDQRRHAPAHAKKTQKRPPLHVGMV